MTMTELSNLLDIYYRALRKLKQSGLIIVSKISSANLEECEYLIKDPAEDSYLQVICKDGEFIVCGDVWQGITLTYLRLLALTYFVDCLNMMLRLKLEGEDLGKYIEGEEHD